MSIPYFAQHLQDNEKINYVAYKSAWMFVPSIFLETALLWSSLFGVFWLQRALGEFGISIAILGGVIALAAMARTVMRLKYTAWIVTNNRLLDFDQHNFWKMEMNATEFTDLHTVKMGFCSFWATLGGCGTVQVRIKSEQALLELDGVKNPRNLVMAIESKIHPETQQ